MYFLLAALESAGFLFALSTIPSEGLSFARLILFGILALALLSALWASINIQKVSSLIDSRFFPKLISASALTALLVTVGLFLLRYLDPARLLVYYERAAPVLYFLLLFSAQSLILFSLLQYGFHSENLSQYKPLLFPFSVFSLFLIFIFILVSVTKLGITPDPAYWGEPGVPIFFWQLFIILVSTVLLFSRLENIKYKFIVPLLVYIAAVVIWLSVPVDVLKTSFYVSIDPPTFQPFPYSDAGYYDWMAHSLLIGHPYQGDIPTRPLFIVFLAFLHMVFGENYRLIIAGQTLFLALIPVIFYYIGKNIYSRAVGITAATFFIFRELNSILISSYTRVSNTKTLLVDLPTLLFVSLSCLLAIKWFKSVRLSDSQATNHTALLAGGVFGLLLLLRTQSMLLLPFIFLVLFLVVYYEQTSKNLLGSFLVRIKATLSWVIRPALMFLLSFALTIAPWLTHNYIQTGKLTFDAPFQYKIIAALYTTNDLSNQSTIDLQGKGMGSILLQSVIKDPKFVFGFIANHFLAGEVDGLLSLPLIKPYNGLFQSINVYWTSWDGNLESYNIFLLIIYLLFISAGLAAAWKRLQWIGLTPLVFNIGYVLATSIGRFSGWRYDLPADWVVYFYFCIGMIESIFFVLSLLLSAPRDLKVDVDVGIEKSTQFSSKSLIFVAVFVLIGALPWFAEKVASPRYPDQEFATLNKKLSMLPGVPEASTIQSFIRQPESFVQIGRALYPRFYIRNDGASSARPWPAYETRDYPRIGFLLLNQTVTHIVVPTRANEVQVPQAVDVIVLGCRHTGYIEARLIALPQTDQVYITGSLEEPCSP